MSPARPSVAQGIERLVVRELKRSADPQKAVPMAAYMKTTMPFYGVQKPAREKIVKQARREFPIENRRDYEATIRRLWKRPHREEKYIAIQLAVACRDLITPDSMPLYERLIREGAWWDFVDDVAIRLVGRCLLDHRKMISKVTDEWLDDDDLWIRRSAVISQILHKDETDARRLFRYCRALSQEKDFFIRKAIGWALRDYSGTDPDAVARFLVTEQTKLSSLSYREGAKALRRIGYDL